MTKPSTRCVRTWVDLLGLPGRLAGAEGGWLGTLAEAGRRGGGKGEGGGGGGLLVPLLPLLSVVVSWEDSSTCGDLITEWLGVMEDEPVTATQ